ncbi:MAG TPA: rhomboid family intramembrane serine protease [Candidatus Limnocylindrales bacterium]|nr:rhomboid family intramembrane serine protease [Candidatus Limnocylindrales bacterium]
MEDPGLNDTSSLLARQGPLTRAEARLLLDGGAELLAAGDFPRALQHYWRVRGFDDPDVTAAALLGAGQALYRMDNEASAVARWEEVLALPETPATYQAYRELASARVRDGDLQGAIAAYREADRRAPPEDKAEIATRLGWLAKETGNVRASRRYFARGRGATIPIVTYAILGITVAVSLTALISTEGETIFKLLELDKRAVAAGELWRLFTVTLVHGGVAVASVSPELASQALIGGLVHLGFNMYALWLVGPVIEQIYGPTRTLVFYLVAALGASAASFAFGPGAEAVGASGAIFGLFGVLFAAMRLHVPMLDRRGRSLASQVGFLIVTSLIFGFAIPNVDNVAHIGGLITGALLGAAFPPGRVATLRTLWQPAAERPLATPGFFGSAKAMVLSLAALAIGIGICMVRGFDAWG